MAPRGRDPTTTCPPVNDDFAAPVGPFSKNPCACTDPSGGAGQAGSVTDLAPALLPNRVFAVARGHLARARSHRARLNDLWNSMRGPGLFSAWIEAPTPATRELWCSFDPSGRLQTEADRAMADFFRSIKLAMDACVLATASSFYRSIGHVAPDTHQIAASRLSR